MELIFESVKERDDFFKNSECCPGECGGKELPDCTCRPGTDSCVECWLNSGVKYRIKNQPTPDYPIPIEEQMSNKEEVKASVWNAWTMMNPGDKLLKTEHGWRIEEKKEEPKQVYTTTGWDRDDWFEEKAKEFLNGIYGVQPRHMGRTATYSFIDEVHHLDSLDRAYRNPSYREYLDIFMDKHDRIKKPQIERVIFNDPATIVFWKDGTKTVVKCQNGDKFDEEKGLAMAICKKVYGEGYWSDVFKKWVPEKKKDIPRPLEKNFVIPGPDFAKYTSAALKKLNDALDRERMAALFGVPGSMLYGEKLINPNGVVKIKTTESKEERKKAPNCKDCLYSGFTSAEEPCCGCGQYTNFTPKEEKKEEPLKTCANCKYSGNTRNWPCMVCGCISRDYFEPRIDK